MSASPTKGFWHIHLGPLPLNQSVIELFPPRWNCFIPHSSPTVHWAHFISISHWRKRKAQNYVYLVLPRFVFLRVNSKFSLQGETLSDLRRECNRLFRIQLAGRLTWNIDRCPLKSASYGVMVGGRGAFEGQRVEGRLRLFRFLPLRTEGVMLTCICVSKGTENIKVLT